MLGIAVRIAQCMGIHNEASLAKHSVFEAEMRRRLWWSIMLYDSQMGEKADHKDVSLSPTWDCKVPLNVNDSDLRVEMKEPPASKTTATESLFVFVRSDLADFVRHASFHLNFTNPALKPIGKALPDNGSLDTLEKHVELECLSLCDPENPIEYLTIWMTRAAIAKTRLLEHYSEHPGSTDGQRDIGMSLATRMLECDTKLMTSTLTKCYRWHLQSYFPFPAYMHILKDLTKRPLSEQAERAWEVLSASYEVRSLPPGSVSNPLVMMFEKEILKAWHAFEATTKSTVSRDPPKIISRIRQQEASLPPVSQPGSFEVLGESVHTNRTLPTLIPVATDYDSLMYGMDGQNDSFGFSSMAYPSASGQDLTFGLGANQSHWPQVRWDLD